MKIEIIDIKKERGAIHLICECIEPIQQQTPFLDSGDAKEAMAKIERLFEQYKTEYEVAMLAFRENIKKIHLGKCELKL